MSRRPELELRRVHYPSTPPSGGSSSRGCRRASPTGSPSADSSSQIFPFVFRPLLTTPQFRGERVLGGARAQHPADDDPYQQHRRDEDEVRRRHLADHRRVPAVTRREISPISRSTLASRLQIDHTYQRTTPRRWRKRPSPVARQAVAPAQPMVERNESVRSAWGAAAVQARSPRRSTGSREPAGLPLLPRSLHPTLALDRLRISSSDFHD